MKNSFITYFRFLLILQILLSIIVLFFIAIYDFHILFRLIGINLYLIILKK